jgi:hypothetical protein
LFEVGVNPGVAVLGAEDEVVVQGGAGICHRRGPRLSALLRDAKVRRGACFPAFKRRATIMPSLRDECDFATWTTTEAGHFNLSTWMG